MWNEYYSASEVGEVLEILATRAERARIVAGATDLLLEIERGVRSGIEALVDISRIKGLREIHQDRHGWIHLGPLVTHNDCVASPLVRQKAFPLARACWEVGAAQIRNRGTVVGNLITASPANDAIPPLMALGAEVKLLSQGGERIVPLESFYQGVRRTVMDPSEFLSEVAFPALTATQRGGFSKHALRAAQAVSVVSVAAVLDLDPGGRVGGAAITLGAVAPTVIHAREAEEVLLGRQLDPSTVAEAARRAAAEARPISDVRAGAEYRRHMVRIGLEWLLQQIARGQERAGFPEAAPLLWGSSHPMAGSLPATVSHREGDLIATRVNGIDYRVQGGMEKTLLRLLREDLGLTGTKEGCAEGECGACTVFLDGVAVMACMIPAARAHGAEVVTVEGLSRGEDLHPVQRAFVEKGGVQCGYCTPGFVMSTVKLLEEIPHPDREQAAWALAGNLCRCTGYYKILDSVERAAELAGGKE
ncbi:MAG: FAD binding domain-containing protein [Anaerolineales bacterium]|jgi:carbon-monoxide dehydrogenase medium subunit